jgi:outer membrane protein assembly factor BamA
MAIAAFLPARAFAQATWPQKVRDIRVYDNTKTQTGTVLDLAKVSKGEDFTPDEIETVKGRLVASGLFSDVNVYYEPYQDGIRLNIIAKDKFAWFVAPTFSASTGNVGGGVAFGHTNLFGRNKKMLVYGAVFSADSRLLVAYQDPSLFGTWLFWRLDGQISRSKIDEFNLALDRQANLSDPELFRRTAVWQNGIGVQLGVQLPLHLRLSAYYRIQQIKYEKACTSPMQKDCGDAGLVPSPPLEPQQMAGLVDQPGPDGTEAYAHFDFGYDSTVNTWGIRTGTAIGGFYELGDKALGSDFKYSKYGANARLGVRFFEEHNLILRSNFTYGKDLPFTEELEAGGGGLRGFNYREFRGDTSIEGHAEYYIPFFWAWSVAFRGLLFYDTQAIWFRNIDTSMPTPGGTYLVPHPEGTYRTFLPEVGPAGNLRPPSSGLDRDNWHNGIGAGLRLYLKSINIPLLGFDFGYGLESKEVRFYVALGLSD